MTFTVEVIPATSVSGVAVEGATLMVSAQGPPGVRGNSVLNGAGDPTPAQGVQGDFYLNTSTMMMWGPKGPTTWPGPPVQIKGSTISNGYGPPNDANGLNGDFYIDLLTYLMYGPKAGGHWGASMSIVGPAPFAAPAAWASSTNYTAIPPASAVTSGGSSYMCVHSHTSSASFAADLAAGLWVLIAQGGGGIPDAPADSTTYGRRNSAWVNVLPVAGGSLTGPLLLAADPTVPLGTATKQYVDNAVGTPATPLSFTPGGRLSLTTGAPIMSASVLGANTIYYTPAVHALVPIYDGAKWTMWQMSGDIPNLTTDATNNPSAAAANQIYDLFIWNKAGSLVMSRGPAWTNATTRSMTLTRVNGVQMNTAGITNGPGALRGTWVGVVVTNASALFDFQFAGAASGGLPGLYNFFNGYNRVRVGAQNRDNGAQYTYAGTSWREWRNSTNNYIQFIIGAIDEAVIDIAAYMHIISGNAAGLQFGIAVGLDSATLPGTGLISYGQTQTAGTFNYSLTIAGVWNCGLGFHTMFGIEWNSSTSIATTFMADATGDLVAKFTY
jgi:hypothetical protein